MSKLNRANLEALKALLIKSDGIGGLTRAADIRQMESAIIDSLLNFLDDVNQPGGYLGIYMTGRVDESFIHNLAPTGQFLKDNGTWADATLSFPGSGNRVVESDAAGVLTATKQFLQPWISDASIITEITDPSNWDGSGAYIGPVIAVKYGQEYADNSYWYRVRQDDVIKRMQLV